MRKILFLLDELPPTKSANGICVSKVIKALHKDGYATSCVCWKAEDKYSTEVHLIPEKPWKLKVDKYGSGGIVSRAWFQILRVAYKVKRIFLLPIWPVDSCKTVNDFYKTASNLIDQEDISLVVAVNYPGETLLAMKRLKKHYKDKIKTVMYPLDVSYVNPYCNGVEHAVSSLFCPRFMKSCSKYADAVLELENAQELFNRIYKKKEQSKFILCGIPLLESVDKTEKKRVSDEIHFVYSGTLQRNVRDPEMAFSVLNRIANMSDKKIILDLYGQIDSQSWILYKNGNYDFGLVNHGWIQESELSPCLQEADVLINLGNMESHLIPSKLFKYMSLGKPIVHFCLTEKDPCVSYLKQYGNARIIYSTESHDARVLKDLVRFSEEKKEINIDLKRVFPRCFPEYTAVLLENLIK